MSVDHRTQLKQWLESGEIRLQPLTFPQRELWETSPVPVGDVANHICAFIQVKGMITAEDCQKTLERVVERQEALRLSFLPGKDQALQMVRRTVVPNTRYRHLTPEESEPEALEEVMKAIFNGPFDLVRGPLFRLELLQRSPDELILVFAIHHAIADGWSLGVFVEDLCAAYVVGMKGGTGILPPVPQSYTAWAAAERLAWTPDALAPRIAFWKDNLKNVPRLWPKPEKSAALSGKLERWISEAPAELTTAVRELARQTGATLFSTLLTAFRTALFHLTGVADIVVGTPVANRNKQATRETMGYFAGVVPLRGRVDPEQPFDESIKATHEGTIDAFANAIPFAEIAAALGDLASPGHNPIFDVRFALQNHPIPDVTLPGMSLKLRMRSTGTARFDLACEVTEDGPTLEVVWLYRAAMFSLDDMKKLDQMFQTILANVCRSPKSRTGAALA
jgi:hypothetical protein